MNSFKPLLVGAILMILTTQFDTPVIGSLTEAFFDPAKIVMEDTGLVVSGNRVGVGLSVPSTSIDVLGSVFIKNTVTYDKIDRGPYSVDWTQGNCQRLVITEDGDIGISLSVPPTMNAHLTLSIQYDAETPGILTVSATAPDIVTWNLGVSQNAPVSHNIDILHFYFQKGTTVSTYNGTATYWYRTDPLE